jgi:hypothetical protein
MTGNGEDRAGWRRAVRGRNGGGWLRGILSTVLAGALLALVVALPGFLAKARANAQEQHELDEWTKLHRQHVQATGFDNLERQRLAAMLQQLLIQGEENRKMQVAQNVADRQDAARDATLIDTLWRTLPEAEQRAMLMERGLIPSQRKKKRGG